MPMTVVPARKSTLLIVDEPLAVTLAPTVTEAPRPSVAALDGLVSVTEGPKPASVTTTCGEVAVLLLVLLVVDVSVTIAVSV